MKKVWLTTLASLLLAAPSAMASDTIYTELSPMPSSAVKTQGCQDAMFSLGEEWFCKDSVELNHSSQAVEESTKLGNQSSEVEVGHDPTIHGLEEQWSEDEPIKYWTDPSFTVDLFIEGGVLYAPAEEVAFYLGLAIMPLDDPKGVALVKGEEDILYFFPDQSKYVLYNVTTDKMEAFALPQRVWQKESVTIVPLDIVVQFADGSMNYNSEERRVTLNNFYTFPVKAQSADAYIYHWSNPERWGGNPYEQPDIPVPAPSAMSREVYSFETDPVNENGRLLVPLRELFEMLGATVDWNAQTKTVTAQKQHTVVQLTIGSKSAYVNGQPKSLDVPGRIVDGKTMIPLRFVSEAFGEKVGYDAQRQEVTIGSRTIFLSKPKSSPSEAPAS